MATVEELLSLAEQQIGNGGAKYWDWYRDHYAPWLGPYVNGAVTQYCAVFDSCMLAWTNTPCAYFPNTFAFDESDWRDGFHDKWEAQAGDMVAFDWDHDGSGDHVGIVKSVHDWGCVTIEGNSVGGIVRERQQVWENIRCVVRPEYDDEEDEVRDEDIERIAELSARKCAEYVYGDEDSAENLNNYNALHWGYRILQAISAKLDRIISKLGA